MHLGGWEIIIILVIVLLIFGPGRITKVAGEMGKSIKAFKDGLGSDKGKEEKEESEQDQDTKK
jgi:sec-independent protein translocase protein TatA